MRLLGLSLTDLFTGHDTDPYSEAERIFAALEDAYERFYYTGMLRERRAKAELRIGRASYMVTALLQDALKCFEEAEKIHLAENDEAILRWNHCVRLVQSRPELEMDGAGTRMLVADNLHYDSSHFPTFSGIRSINDRAMRRRRLEKPSK